MYSAKMTGVAESWAASVREAQPDTPKPLNYGIGFGVSGRLSSLLGLGTRCAFAIGMFRRHPCLDV